MSINIHSPEVLIREIRLNSVLAYHGTAKDLCTKSGRESLSCRDCSFNQAGDCSAQRALLQVILIRDAAVVNHGPIGCAADFSGFNKKNRGALVSRGYEAANIKAISSNLQEKDTIYGGETKLEDGIREAYRRFDPKAIFVTTSCASGIIGDDIEGVINRMEDELRIPVVPIYCEGFKSKVWTTGFDAAFHGIVRKLVKPPKTKSRDVINVFNFSDSEAFTPLLAKIGLRPNYLVPHSSVQELEHIAEAAATAHICETLGTYVARALEQEYGVPEIKSPPPFGFAWTDSWLREVGKITHREQAVEELIRSEREKVKPALEKLRSRLAGKKACILAGASYGHNLLAIASDLGMEIVGLTGFHHDQKFDNPDKRLNSLQNVLDVHGDIRNYSICNKQPYQVINLLRRIKPDLLLTRHENMPVLGTKLGIPTFFAADANIGIGYSGVIRTGEKIVQVLQMQKLVKNMAKHARFPYTDWWYEQDPFMYQAGESL